MSLYFPESQMDHSEGILVGFNFQEFLFVVTEVVPPSKITNMKTLMQILEEPKFKKFNWYCGGSPMVLGVIETPGDTNSSRLRLSKSKEVLALQKE